MNDGKAFRVLLASTVALALVALLSFLTDAAGPDFPQAPAAPGTARRSYLIALPPAEEATAQPATFARLACDGVQRVEPLGYFRGLRLARVQASGGCGSPARTDVLTATGDPALDAVLPALSNPAQAARWVDSSPPVRPVMVYTLPDHAWRIGIVADGVYRISYGAMSAAGVPLSGARPADFHLLSMGKE